MRKIQAALPGVVLVLSGLWIAAGSAGSLPTTFFALRATVIQYSGILGIGCMSVAMILAMRPRWPEEWLGGLDKMYRLHKWLGVTGLVVAVIHWLWAQGPKWAVAWNLLPRPVRGPRPVLENPIELLFQGLRGTAEGMGQWAFYAAAMLIVLALIPRFPYRWFFKTHRVLAAAYLVLVFHAVVLIEFSYWTTPLGAVMAPLLAYGAWSAAVVLTGRVGGGRRVQGTLASVRCYPGVRSLETAIWVPQGWPGHKSGQFAFVTWDRSEGAHPFTIASAWNGADRKINFVIKELGDHTSRLREMLKIGQRVAIEGPYGCFTFDDGRPRQIWIGGGIGITPFIARMKQMAQPGARQVFPVVHLFHTTIASQRVVSEA